MSILCYDYFRNYVGKHKIFLLCHISNVPFSLPNIFFIAVITTVLYIPNLTVAATLSFCDV